MALAHLSRHDRRFCLLCSCLLLLLGACSSVTTSSPSSTIATSETTITTPPVPSPSAQGDCPATGTARPAMLPSMILGNHQTVVYSVDEYRVNEGGVNQPTFGTLKRYDVATGQKTEIVKMPGTEISDAQVSADGQWLLFVAVAGKQAKLQLMRMDGKELQTLYCAQPSDSSTGAYFSLGDVQWSRDQQLVVFNGQVNNMITLYLLNMQDGHLQTELSGTRDFSVLNWLDSTRLYLNNPGVDAPPTNLYLLDTNRAAQLQSVYQTDANVFCWDAASSIDGTQLFLSQCTTDNDHQSSPSAFPFHGPSSVTIRSATGGPSQTIFTSTSLGIKTVRVISQTSLLLLVKSRGPRVDSSLNGLWKVNTTGTGLTFLSRDSAQLDSSLNRNSQYPWSNVSRDGGLYSLQSEIFTPPGIAHYSLLVGSLHGGTPMAFASISDGTSLDLVGWTTM